jgi:hypothetical protein
MKNKNISTRLQKQYNKLQSRINKAIKSGKFYSYTAYKQQQLKSRLQRYALQLRQLATGMAVCAALGVAAPASAQLTVLPLLDRSNNNNPLDTFAKPNNHWHKIVFADLDNDGDFDAFQTRTYLSVSGITNYTTSFEYYENTGTAASPLFEEKFGVDNPLDTFENKIEPSFVDIDADGDLDMFLSNQDYLPGGTRYLHYYENTGTASNPAFIERTGAMNPLDTVGAVIDAEGVNSGYSPNPSFVDLDADGDMDCVIFVRTDFNYFYKNEGTSTNPSFQLQPSSLNPVDQICQTENNFGALFYDFDHDNDLDYVVKLKGLTAGMQAVENVGDSATASYSLSNVILLDSTLNGAIALGGRYMRYSFVDIDGDGDEDLFEGEWYGNAKYRYYENMEIVVGLDWRDKSIEKIGIYPNPGSGRINFNKAMNGKLFVYGRDGRVLKSLLLTNNQSVDLSDLPNGLYYMILEEEEKRFEGTFVVEK